MRPASSTSVISRTLSAEFIAFVHTGGCPMIVRRKKCASTVALVVLLVLSWNAGAARRAAEDPFYDTVIRGGRVIDGGGNPWIIADVAIRDGKFVKVGKVEGRGRREIDARGKYV